MSATISFAWTTAALVNGRKTETRREWQRDYAARFRGGDRPIAYDRQPYYGGNQVAIIELTDKPYPDFTRKYDFMQAYEAEGFAFYDEHPELMPVKWKKSFAACDIADFREYFELEYSRHCFEADNYARTGKIPAKFWYVVPFRLVQLLHPESDKYLLENLLKEARK
jgi:hypothetical protein